MITRLAEPTSNWGCPLSKTSDKYYYTVNNGVLTMCKYPDWKMKIQFSYACHTFGHSLKLNW